VAQRGQWVVRLIAAAYEQDAKRSGSTYSAAVISTQPSWVSDTSSRQ
jgi:hypothetical protein